VLQGCSQGFSLVTALNPYPTMNGFFGPDASYRAEKGILISAIYFKKYISYKTLLFGIFLIF